MDGVLNESTRTVHKHERGGPELHTACGVTYTVHSEKLREIPVEQAVAATNASKCGRCFEDGGGY